MGINKFPNYNELILNKACLSTTADATNVITVGNVAVAAVTYANGTAINALSADSWTDVQDINLGVPFVFQITTHSTRNALLEVLLDAETAGDYVRAQWELDGVAVMDITVGPSKSQKVYGFGLEVSAVSVPSFPMFAKSRFRVRLYKHGTIDQAGSLIGIGAIRYQEVTI